MANSPNLDINSFSQELLNSMAPIAVPDVLVMISVVPDSRVGRYACKISTVRLRAPPRKMAMSNGFLSAGFSERYEQTKKPRGTTRTPKNSSISSTARWSFCARASRRGFSIANLKRNVRSGCSDC